MVGREGLLRFVLVGREAARDLREEAGLVAFGGLRVLALPSLAVEVQVLGLAGLVVPVDFPVGQDVDFPDLIGVLGPEGVLTSESRSLSSPFFFLLSFSFSWQAFT